MKLFDYMPATNEKTSTNNKTSLELRIKEYFNTCNLLSENQLDTFWRQHQNLWPELASFAKMILSIPATSAPAPVMFLKCNLHL